MGEALIDQLDEVINALAAIDPHDLANAAVLERTERMLRAQRRFDGLIASQLQVMDARDVTTSERGRSTRGWLVEEQQLSELEARARMRVARAGVARPAIIDALRDGSIAHKHAELIVNFLPRLDADARDVAEKELLDAAPHIDPGMLARGLRELRDKFSLDETAEERAVRQHEDRWLRLTETFGGMTRIDGMLDPVASKIVRTALEPLAQRAGDVDKRSAGQRGADAVVELARLAMNRGQVPDTAGEPTQVVVQTFLADLLRRLEVGDLTVSTLNGTPITPNNARMFACDAGVIPIVMGGDSEVLDLGRSTRTWTRAQRKAAKLRAHGHCESPGCQASIDRCDLHHDEHWAQGGKSDLGNAIYLCSYHHWLTHHTPWTISRGKHGGVTIRRT